MRRLGLAVVAIAVAAVAIWGGSVLLDNYQRAQPADRLLAAIQVTPDGGVVDLATAYDRAWNRAVVVSPYSNGATANAALGFDYYPPDDSLTPDDAASRLLFVSGQSVEADIALDGRVASFEDGFETFDHNGARFVVERKDGWATLVQQK